jgi:hypothetical protein
MSSVIDQDEFGHEAIVWWGEGEIIGNYVEMSIREFEGVYKWFVKVRDSWGAFMAQTGLASTLDEAVLEAQGCIMCILEVDPD